MNCISSEESPARKRRAQSLCDSSVNATSAVNRAVRTGNARESPVLLLNLNLLATVPEYLPWPRGLWYVPRYADAGL